MVNKTINLEDSDEDNVSDFGSAGKITKQKKITTKNSKKSTTYTKAPPKKPGRQSEKSKIEEIMQLSANELKAMCIEDNLPTSGTKQVLVERLLNPSMWDGGRKRTHMWLPNDKTQAAAITSRMRAEAKEEKKQRLEIILEKVRNKNSITINQADDE